MRHQKRFIIAGKPGNTVFRDRKLRAGFVPPGSEEYWDAQWQQAEIDEELAEEGYPQGSGFGGDLDGPPAIGVCAVDTGLLNASGQPVIRHPVRIRVGFHLEENKYHTPTAEDDGDGSASIVGWAYEV